MSPTAVAGGLDELDVVEGDERLERRGRGLTPHDTDVSFGGVQQHHRGRWTGSFPIGVETAPMTSLAGLTQESDLIPIGRPARTDLVTLRLSQLEGLTAVDELDVEIPVAVPVPRENHLLAVR